MIGHIIARLIQQELTLILRIAVMMSIFEVGLAISRLPIYWRDGKGGRGREIERT